MNQFISRFRQFFGQPETQGNALKAYFLSALVMIMLLLFPARQYYETNKINYMEHVSVNSWIVANLSGISKNTNIAENTPFSASGNSLLSLVSVANRKGMLSRIEKRESEVIVTIDQARLSHVLIWLGNLSKEQGVNLQNTAINYIDNDMISAKFIFSE